MGTRSAPITPTLAGAARHQVTYLEIYCLCGRAIMVPILLACWRHGPDLWLEKMPRHYRCAKCGQRAWHVERHWRRPRDYRWWKGLPKRGPCE